MTTQWQIIWVVIVAGILILWLYVGDLITLGKI